MQAPQSMPSALSSLSNSLTPMRHVAQAAVKKSGAVELEAGKGLQREKAGPRLFCPQSPSSRTPGCVDGRAHTLEIERVDSLHLVAETSAIWTTTLRPLLTSSAAGVEDLMP